jgi:hypothetical protein
MTYDSGWQYAFDLSTLRAESVCMNNKRNNTELDTELFDPEHDMDLVALLNNAQTDNELQAVIRMSRYRMRARRSALGQKQPRRGFSLRVFKRLTPAA